MNARLYDRLAAGISVALLLALGAGTYYLAQISGRFDRPALGRPVGHEPDYFVEKLVFTRLNARGEPAFRVSAERALHFQDDDTTEYESPRLVSLDPARPRVTVNARQGRTSADGNETHLEGDVVLTRHAAPGSPPIVVTTDYAVVHADTEVARTDRPVVIRYGESTLTGVGMEFNNAARSFRIDSQVRGRWQQPPRTP